MCALCKGQAAILLDTLINEFRYCCSSLCLSLRKDNERSYIAVQEIVVLHVNIKGTPGDCLCFTSKQFPARKGKTLYRNPISVNNQVSHIYLMCHIPCTCSPAECADP